MFYLTLWCRLFPVREFQQPSLGPGAVTAPLCGMICSNVCRPWKDGDSSFPTDSLRPRLLRFETSGTVSGGPEVRSGTVAPQTRPALTGRTARVPGDPFAQGRRRGGQTWTARSTPAAPRPPDEKGEGCGQRDDWRLGPEPGGAWGRVRDTARVHPSPTSTTRAAAAATATRRR